MKKIIPIALLLFLSSSLLGQDYHLSQYFAAPLDLNAALTGVFNGDIRLVANYRDQWGSFASFKTYSASIDASLFKKKLKGSFWGGGMMFYSDNFENAEFTTTQVSFSGSYNQMLSKKPKHYLSFGVQASYVDRLMNMNNLNFGTLWEENNNYDPLIQGNAGQVSFMDISSGLLWYTILNKRTDLYAGIAGFHLTSPNLSFTNTEEDRLFMKFAIHGGAEFSTSEKVSLLPTTVFFIQGPSIESNIGTYLKYYLDKKHTSAVYGGAWFRFAGSSTSAVGGDAVILGTRLDIKGFSFGFSYDINVSKLNAFSELKGGPEISIIYIANFKKRKQGTRYCPGF